MNPREQIIRQWFEMWLTQKDTGIDRIFSENVTYTESWGPEYHGSGAVKHWFEEWNTRGKVLTWDIRQFIQQENQTVVEWYFKNRMADGRTEEFDGISLIRWTKDGRISSLKEFGCNRSTYDPYEHGAIPHFREESARWF